MKEKFYRFMQGRYGVDTLNKFLITIMFVLMMMNLFIRNSIINTIMWVLLIVVYYRMFSRNIYKRYNENSKFLSLIKPITNFKLLLNKRKNDSYNQYYLCSKCGQILRVPKGKGKIEVRCPKCSHTFVRKT